ncbi:MAG: O-antigen ligase family protein [Planctomycetes bacterium]|nr:O-antigen ligase family protein [Planctomycetota bacterium]
MIDLLLYLLFVLSLVCLILSIVKPFYGVVGYLIIFMARFPEFMPGLAEIRFEFIVGWYVLLRVFLSPGAVSRVIPRANRVASGLLFLLLLMLISVPQAVDPAASWTKFIEYLKVFALSYMVLGLVDDRSKLEALVSWFVVLTGWLALGPFHDFFTGNFIVAQDVRRVVGEQGYFRNPNALANNVCQGIPFLFYGLLTCRGRAKKVVFSAILVMSSILVILTGSRGGFLYLATVMFMFVFRSQNRGRALLRLSIVAVILFSFMAKDYSARILTIFEFGKDGLSSQSRIDGLVHGFGMMVKRPLLGVGIGCYPIARKVWFGWGLWAHNHYGELMGELGLTGTIVWFWFLVAVFKNIAFVRRTLEADRDRDRWLLGFAYAMEAALIGRLVAGMTVHSLGVFFWYMVGALSVSARQEAERIEAEREGEEAVEEGQGDELVDVAGSGPP